MNAVKKAAGLIAAELQTPEREILVTPELADVADQAIEALSDHQAVYQRQGSLVQVANGSIRDLPMSVLACELTRVARWVRPDAKGEERACAPPERIVAAVHQCGAWPGLRTLHGIVNTPTMRPDGSILETPGYDAATHLIYDPNANYPAVGETPSKDEALDALMSLLEPFEEFPYDSNADKLVPAAIVLTALAMPALGGCNFPCFLIDANVQGTGKTLLADTCAWILTGKEVPKQTFPSDGAELEKMLGGAARAATPMLCLDNVNCVFGGDALESRMTCRGTSQFRILGQTQNQTLPWRTVALASGNNVRTTVDMRRRIVRCRLVSPDENPEERVVKRPGLRAWVLARRPALVAAGLTILRAYDAAGRPKQETAQMGNFEEWTNLVAGALMWLKGVDVLDARLPAASGADPATEAYSEFLTCFGTADGVTSHWELGKPYTAKQLAPMQCWDGIIPAEDRNRAIRVGQLLRQMNQRPIAGRQVEMFVDKHIKANRYRVTAVPG